VAGMENQVQVALLGPGGQAGGRTGPLTDHDDQWGFGHARQADPFASSGQTRRPRWPPCWEPRRRRPQGHVDHGNFILGLLDDDPQRCGLGRQSEPDGSGGRHGVKSENFKPAARAPRAMASLPCNIKAGRAVQGRGRQGGKARACCLVQEKAACRAWWFGFDGLRVFRAEKIGHGPGDLLFGQPQERGRNPQSRHVRPDVPGPVPHRDKKTTLWRAREAPVQQHKTPVGQFPLMALHGQGSRATSRSIASWGASRTSGEVLIRKVLWPPGCGIDNPG